MFGYIYPDKPEMRVMDLHTFQGHYCGLCKTLHDDYNLVSRLLLNYDCTFLYAMLNALSEKSSDIKQENCAFVPFRKRIVIYGEGRSYAAGLNVLLAWNKALDNVRDEKSKRALAFKIFYSRAYKKAKRNFPDQARIIEKGLGELSALENENCSDIDQVSDVFSRLLGGVLKNAPGFDEKDQRKLYHLGYNLGRWIYLIDALDDIEKDVRDHSYNIFLARYGSVGQSAEEFKKKRMSELEFNLYYSLSEASKAFELLDIHKNRQLLDNIIYSGLKKKTKEVLERRSADESVQGSRCQTRRF